jgi:hypothetical protein
MDRFQEGTRMLGLSDAKNHRRLVCWAGVSQFNARLCKSLELECNRNSRASRRYDKCANYMKAKNWESIFSLKD